MNHWHVEHRSPRTAVALVASALAIAACESSHPTQVNTPSSAQSSSPSSSGMYGSTTSGTTNEREMTSGTSQEESVSGRANGPSDRSTASHGTGMTSSQDMTAPAESSAMPSTSDDRVSQATQTVQPSSPYAGQGAVSSDAQVAGILQTIHQGELEQAELAQTKASTAEVKRFARTAVSTYRSRQSKENALFSRLQTTPAETPLTQQLRTDAQNQLSTLQSLQGRDFDQTFIDEQVRHQSRALDLLERMSPRIKSPELKEEVEGMRADVDGRLREAERIQRDLSQGRTSTQPPVDTPVQHR